MSEANTPSSFLTKVANNTKQQVAGNRSVIPKEQLTAYQRWELPSFNASGSTAQTAALALASAEELQRIKQQSLEEGYASGHGSGYTVGHDAGYAAGIQQAKIEAGEIHKLLQNLQEALNQVDQQTAQALLDLSLEVARKMVHETLQVKPEIILEIIREAINSLPQFNQNAHLILHPDDAELVRKHMNDELTHAGWKIFTDAKIQHGGCLVKTAHSLIEATTEARWKRILQSIGQDHSWLA